MPKMNEWMIYAYLQTPEMIKCVILLAYEEIILLYSYTNTVQQKFLKQNGTKNIKHKNVSHNKWKL